jgi:hypothetical protein
MAIKVRSRQGQVFLWLVLSMTGLLIWTSFVVKLEPDPALRIGFLLVGVLGFSWEGTKVLVPGTRTLRSRLVGRAPSTSRE